MCVCGTSLPFLPLFSFSVWSQIHSSLPCASSSLRRSLSLAWGSEVSGQGLWGHKERKRGHNEKLPSILVAQPALQALCLIPFPLPVWPISSSIAASHLRPFYHVARQASSIMQIPHFFFLLSTLCLVRFLAPLLFLLLLSWGSFLPGASPQPPASCPAWPTVREASSLTPSEQQEAAAAGVRPIWRCRLALLEVLPSQGWETFASAVLGH